MTFDYDKSGATALRLLEKFGQDGIIRTTGRTGGGATDPTGGTASQTDTGARMAVLPVSQRDVDGSVIRTGDWRIIIQALAFDITTDHRIICSEGELTILDPGRFAPSGQVVFYDARARG